MDKQKKHKNVWQNLNKIVKMLMKVDSVFVEALFIRILDNIKKLFKNLTNLKENKHMPMKV